MTSAQRMSNVDAAWLGMDSPDNLMMVTAVLGLEETVDRAAFLELLRERLVARYPRFAMRAVPTRSPLEQPVWVDDPAFDLEDHVRDAGSLTDEADLEQLVSGLLGTPLDMSRSPWQMHLVRLTSGGAAVVVRIHHCVADGIALASVLLSLTDRAAPDEEPDEAPDERPDPAPADGVTVTSPPSAPDDLRRPGLLHRLVDGGRDVTAVADVDLVPPGLRQAGRLVAFGYRVVRTGLGLLLAARDPRSRLTGRLGTSKGAAWTEPVDLLMVRRVAAALGATVNDVMLAVTAGALRRHLVEHGDRPHDIRIFVPVDLRRGEPVSASLGNLFGLVFLKLPIAEADPLARVRAVHERMRRVRPAEQAAATFALLSIVGALPAWGHRLAVRLLGAKSTAIVTNVPGPRRPVRLGGVRVLRLVFWVPQAGSVGVGVSILSYAGDVVVGIAADRNLVPEPGALRDAVAAELDALVRLALPVDGEVTLQAVPFDSDLARSVVAEVQQEYVRRYGGADATPVDPDEFAAPDGTFLVAQLGADVIGSAGMRRHGPDVVEVKRMFVRPEHRRRGHGRRLLSALEDWARSRGYRRVVLETGLAQPEAIALYTAAGYEPVEGFGHYKDEPLSRSFGKEIG